MKSKVSDHGLNLLTVNSPKTVKGERSQYVTGILYLAPARSSGFNVCPKASPGCIAACLNTAGRGAMSKIQNARIRKTLWFFRDRASFMASLASDVKKLSERATRAAMRLCVRLNGTSDILWHRIPLDYAGKRWSNIHSAFSDVQFYDYTKQAPSKFSGKPANLHVTFSRSETNDADARKLALAGWNVAVVFRETLPASWYGLPVHDADSDDLRFLDPSGHVAGLKAKGRGKRDASGFVIDLERKGDTWQ